MPASWKQLTFIPSSEALHALREYWGWLVGIDMQPFMSSVSGDVFFEAPDLTIHWLDTGGGRFERIAKDRDEFLGVLRNDGGAEWLLSPAIDRLIDAGVTVGPDQCFAFRVLPILGGTYTPDNMIPMSAEGWYSFSGYVHKQIKDLPDGTQISFTFDGDKGAS
jgi:hypothetical protein